jgi:hypothetical protein
MTASAGFSKLVGRFGVAAIPACIGRGVLLN